MATGHTPTIMMKTPRVLEQTGETLAKFQTWQTFVVNYFDQDPTYEQYFPGGRYETWTSASLAPRAHKGRLQALFVRGPNTPSHHRSDVVDEAQVKIAAEKILAGSYAGMNEQARADMLAELTADRLALRNRQLNKMLQILSTLVYETEAQGVVKDSTSIEWIWSFLRKRHNIETRGANFLKISAITFKAGTNPQVFYNQLRHGFVENLRKVGDVRNHLIPGDVMVTDETLSPSFEDTIVLMTLERIDPRLPARVARDYEHRLDKNTHLSALAPSILQAVPAMIEALDRDAGLHALASQPAPVTMDAFAPRGGGQGRNQSRGRGGFGQNRGGYGQNRGGYGQSRGGSSRGHPRISPTTGRPWTEKMCRLCESKGKSPAVVASHNTTECDSFSKADLRAMLASLQTMDLSPNNQDDDDYEDAYDGNDGGLDGDYSEQEPSQRPQYQQDS